MQNEQPRIWSRGVRATARAPGDALLLDPLDLLALSLRDPRVGPQYRIAPHSFSAFIADLSHSLISSHGPQWLRLPGLRPSLVTI